MKLHDDTYVANENLRKQMDMPDSCEFCGEKIWYVDHPDIDGTTLPPDDLGEFYNPERIDPDGGHKIGHAQCGIDWGWEIA